MYALEFAKKAEHQLKKLERPLQERIIAALERARIRPDNYFKRLVGQQLYSLRIGDYRAIAAIENQRLIILVLKVGHRRNVYK